MNSQFNGRVINYVFAGNSVEVQVNPALLDWKLQFQKSSDGQSTDNKEQMKVETPATLARNQSQRISAEEQGEARMPAQMESIEGEEAKLASLLIFKQSTNILENEPKIIESVVASQCSGRSKKPPCILTSDGVNNGDLLIHRNELMNEPNSAPPNSIKRIAEASGMEPQSQISQTQQRKLEGDKLVSFKNSGDETHQTCL